MNNTDFNLLMDIMDERITEHRKSMQEDIAFLWDEFVKRNCPGKDLAYYMHDSCSTAELSRMWRQIKAVDDVA